MKRAVSILISTIILSGDAVTANAAFVITHEGAVDPVT